MYSEVVRRIARLVDGSDPTLLEGRRIGLERETLRVDASGVIATTDHPEALGSALCHPSITTDFSEALVEMVTPPMPSARAAHQTLEGIHAFVSARLENDETLWSASMPCVLHGDDSIRIGEYGSSHAGHMKHVYRRGLGVRYGRRMQAIAGIHFNFSLPEEAWGWRVEQAGQQRSVSDAYFSMMQNLTAFSWLVPFLFGASPAICRTFLEPGTESDLDTLAQATRFAPNGTSLRMGNIGYRYRDDAKIDLSVDHTRLDHWIDDVIGHVSTPHPAYTELGLNDEQGERQQLSDHRLQIENEYYGTVRPKQIAEPGEMPILALARRGVRYLELRSLDIDPYEPAGLSLETVAMLELMMLFAWLADPLPLDDADLARIKANMKLVAHDGRQPGLELDGPDGPIVLQAWARAILEPLRALAHWLDAAPDGDGLYTRALELQLAKLEDSTLLPSARVLADVQEAGSFADFTALRSLAHHETLLEREMEPDLGSKLQQQVEASRVCQFDLEQGSSGDFVEWLDEYLSQLEPAAAQAAGRDGTGKPLDKAVPAPRGSEPAAAQGST